MSFNKMQTLQGVIRCTVPEFDATSYKGLRSGIGKQRKSSTHFNCKDKCCANGPYWKEGKTTNAA